MKLKTEFYKLPLQFDVERLAEEVSQFTASDWRSHPDGFPGNSAIPLISVRGEVNDAFAGEMMPTGYLRRSPYIQQVLAAFQSVFGRSRLMRLAAGAVVPPHSDTRHHWHTRVRIHILIVTDPDVLFYCNQKHVRMAAGEAWILDAWKTHWVENRSGRDRVHLVADTSGSPAFWDMVANGEKPFDAAAAAAAAAAAPRKVPYVPDLQVQLQTEKYNVSQVMSPGEIDGLIADLELDLRTSPGLDPEDVVRFVRAMDRFRFGWRSLWSLHGDNQSGWAIYGELIRATTAEVEQIRPLTLASNHVLAADVLRQRVLNWALHPQVVNAAGARAVPPPPQGAVRSVAGAANTLSPWSAPRAQAAAPDIGRVQPCPCGSGKKYKYCHA